MYILFIGHSNKTNSDDSNDVLITEWDETIKIGPEVNVAERSKTVHRRNS